MITGIGADLVEIRRMERLFERYSERLLARVLTSAEQEQCRTEKRAARFVASRFAAKEAATKALGTGLKAPFHLHNMEVRREPGGPPRLVFLHAAEDELAKRYGANLKSWLSLSDEADYALAVVVLEMCTGDSALVTPR